MRMVAWSSDAKVVLVVSVAVIITGRGSSSAITKAQAPVLDLIILNEE